jgi:hypothetical protein
MIRSDDPGNPSLEKRIEGRTRMFHHRRRFAATILTGVIYALLWLLDLRVALSHVPVQSILLRVGFSSLVGCLFLVVGAMVWVYATRRRVALILFGFATFAAYTFVVEVGATVGDAVLSAVAAVSSGVSLACFAVLLLLFPHNLLTAPDTNTATAKPERHRPKAAKQLVWALRCYLVALLAMAMLAVGGAFASFIPAIPQHASWFNTVISCYMLFGLTGAALTAGLSYRLASGIRERQQSRLLVSGVVIAVAPFTVLTVLPQLFHLPTLFVVDSQISTTSFCILPLALGYSILRYQSLLCDRDISRGAAQLAGISSLLVLAYLLVTCCSLLLPGDMPLQAGIVLTLMGTLGSWLWWLIQAQAERLFCSESRYYRGLLDQPERLERRSFNLGAVVRYIVQAAKDAFGTQVACLLILDDEAGCFRPSFPPAERTHEAQALLGRVFSCATPVQVCGKGSEWVDARSPVLARLAGAKRPLLLSELADPDDTSWPRTLKNQWQGNENALLAALRVRSKLVGVLVLGPRGDGQMYAGPDFEILDFIFARYGPVFETARMYGLDGVYAALAMKLYQSMPLPRKAEAADHYTTLEDVVQDYARVAATATSSGVEVWLVSPQEDIRTVLRTVRIGHSASLLADKNQEVVALLRAGEEHTAPRFASWPGSPDWASLLPLCERTGHGEDRGKNPEQEAFPFAWLPLQRGDHLYGILTLTYTRPHVFSQREQHLLALFAHQCAATLESTQKTNSLKAADRQQKKQVQLRNRRLQDGLTTFRRPLALIEGYVDLLRKRNPVTPEDRDEWLQRTKRLSRELLRMIDRTLDGNADERRDNSTSGRQRDERG